MEKTVKNKWDKPIFILYIILYIVICLSMVFKQPFGNPPDEANRYKIPLYIYEHHSLPTGFEEEIRIPGYGISYGFQPYLPYIFQGGLMILVGNFTDNTDVLLYVARLVNFFFGLLMALFVWKISKEWFKSHITGYLFAFLVTFLPEAIFLHTYVNLESGSLLSISMILYGLTIAFKDNFSYKACTYISIGVILCALSYYNAYGYILSAILLFIAWHIKKEAGGKLTFDTKGFFKKGGFICAIVLLGIAWWFIRSAVLYNGDILGLKTRDLCREMYKDPSLFEIFKDTPKQEYHSVIEMLFKTDFLLLSTNSFICAYGAMDILTGVWVYRFFKLVFLIGVIALLIPKNWVKENGPGFLVEERAGFNSFFYLNILMCIAIPVGLSIFFSYSTDYQPQGRYFMPAIIPFAFLVARGLEKGVALGTKAICYLIKKEETGFFNLTLKCVSYVIIALIIVSIIVTTYAYAFPKWSLIP